MKNSLLAGESIDFIAMIFVIVKFVYLKPTRSSIC